MAKLTYQILMEPSLFQAVKSELTGANIDAKNDSQVANYVFSKFLDYETNVKITMSIMKEQLDRLKTQNKELTDSQSSYINEIDKINQHRTQLETENKQQKEKIKELVSYAKPKTKPGKKKRNKKILPKT